MSILRLRHPLHLLTLSAVAMVATTVAACGSDGESTAATTGSGGGASSSGSSTSATGAGGSTATASTGSVSSSGSTTTAASTGSAGSGGSGGGGFTCMNGETTGAISFKANGKLVNMFARYRWGGTIWGDNVDTGGPQIGITLAMPSPYTAMCDPKSAAPTTVITYSPDGKLDGSTTSAAPSGGGGSCVVTVGEFGAPGEAVVGTFSGKLVGNGYFDTITEGTFSVIRCP